MAGSGDWVVGWERTLHTKEDRVDVRRRQEKAQQGIGFGRGKGSLEGKEEARL